MDARWSAHFRCVLGNGGASDTENGSAQNGRTDDEVDLRTKVERQKLVAHELGHLNELDNAVFRNTLRAYVRQ